MKKVSIHPVIVKSKSLTDGSHRVRLSIAHNSATRYIPLSIIVPSEKNLKKGEVVGLPNAAALNRKIRSKINEFYDICDNISGIEFISCSELVDVLTSGGLKSNFTFEDVSKEWLDSKVSISESSIDVYNVCIRSFSNFAGESYNLSLLTPSYVNKYYAYLKNKGLSSSTINDRIGVLRCICNFATKKRLYFSYKIDPFADYIAPRKNVRKVNLSIDELRAFRDYKFIKKNHRYAQSFFMLSFYMCGMNTCDILQTDFSKPSVKFKRIKTANRINEDSWTEFSIPQEAKMLLKNGNISFKKKQSVNAITSKLQYSFDTMREMAIPTCPRLIYYSARKTFAQIAAELGFADSVIEYCIGDQHSASKPIDFYRRVTKEMADDAIRIIFDFVASDKDVRTFKKERGLL